MIVFVTPRGLQELSSIESEMKLLAQKYCHVWIMCECYVVPVQGIFSLACLTSMIAISTNREQVDPYWISFERGHSFSNRYPWVWEDQERLNDPPACLYDGSGWWCSPTDLPGWYRAPTLATVTLTGAGAQPLASVSESAAKSEACQSFNKHLDSFRASVDEATVAFADRLSFEMGSSLPTPLIFIKDRIENGEINLLHCLTGDMIADFFTKPLQGSLFTKFKDIIMGSITHFSTLTTPAQMKTKSVMEKRISKKVSFQKAGLATESGKWSELPPTKNERRHLISKEPINRPIQVVVLFDYAYLRVTLSRT